MPRYINKIQQIKIYEHCKDLKSGFHNRRQCKPNQEVQRAETGAVQPTIQNEIVRK